MRKICVAVAAMVAMSAAFVACTNELDVPAGSAVVEGQTGRVVLNVNTGKSVSFTRGVTPEEQRLNVLSLHVFDALGQRVPGIQIEHSPDDLVNGKLSVNLPSDLMNKTGFKAYLLANVTSVNSQTESEFLGTIASTPMDKISEWGIPMASAPISLNTTTAVITAEAVMKRAMSTLFVKVNAATSGGTLINAGDFTYKIKNTRGDRGYLLKDGVSEGAVTPEVTWTPKANTNDEELLGYMYQSNGFEVEITPSVDKPELGSASRTVVVTADKANKRNKKYVLNVLPKVSDSGTVDFTVTIEDWDATDGNFNVDWTERVSISQNGLPSFIKEVDGEIVLTPVYDGMDSNLEYSAPKDWFSMNNGAVFKDIAVTPLIDSDGNGLSMLGARNVLIGNCLNLTDISGKATVTTIKDNVLAKQDFPVRLEGCYVKTYSGRVLQKEGSELRAHCISSSSLVIYDNPDGHTSAYPVITLGPSDWITAEGWTITRVGNDKNLSSGLLSNKMTLTMTGKYINFRLRFGDNVANESADFSSFFIEMTKGDKKIVRQFFVRYERRYRPV